MKQTVHPITIYLPVETWEKLSRIAKDDGRKVSWLARKIIMDKVEQYETSTSK